MNIQLPWDNYSLKTAPHTILGYPAIKLFFDGKCQPKNPGGVACAGWHIDGVGNGDMPDMILAEGHVVIVKGGPKATNNYAEWCGLGFGLKFLTSLFSMKFSDGSSRPAQLETRPTRLEIIGDSQLIINQLTGEWACRKETLIPLRGRCKKYLEDLGFIESAGDLDWAMAPEDNLWRASWVPREQNTHADALTNQAYQNYMQNKAKRS